MVADFISVKFRHPSVLTITAPEPNKEYWRRTEVIREYQRILYTFGDMELPDKQKQSIEDQKNAIGAYVAEKWPSLLEILR